MTWAHWALGVFSLAWPLLLQGCGYEAQTWSFSVPESDGLIQTTPLIAVQKVHVGTAGGKFYAVHMQNGSLSWEFQAGGSITSPRIYDHHFYFGAGTKLYAINVRGGLPEWEFEAGAPVRTVPVANERLSVMYFGTEGGKMFGLRLTEEMPQKLWEFSAGGAILSSPSLSKNWRWTQFYFGCDDGYIYALNEVSGSIEWRFDAESFVRASPTVNNDQVLIGSGNGIFYALSELDGGIDWRFTAGSPIYSTAAVHRGYVYFGCDNGDIFALLQLDGQVMWKAGTGSAVRAALPAIVDSGRIYFGTENGTLHAIQEQTGTQDWTFETKGPIRAAAVWHYGIIYFASDKLYTLKWDGTLTV